MSIDQWLIFVAIWTAASLPLGPNALNMIVSSVTNGFYRSLWGIIGILLAALCHMAATIFGVATILLANAMLFQILKFAGAAYLIWMGITLWRKKDVPISIQRSAPASPARLIGRGFLVSISNPKAVLAYLAVFSQFIHPETPLFEQLIVLIPTALTIGFVVYLGYGALGSGIQPLFKTVKRRIMFNRGVGSFYIMSGVGLASTDASVK